MTIHHIQEEILHTLMLHPNSLRYNEINVSNVANDQFNYHLQTLCRKGLVTKVESRYELSIEGKKNVEEILALGVIRPKADKYKLYSHAVILDKANKKLISRTRLRQPFYGDRGIHGVSVSKGESTYNTISKHYKKCLNIRLIDEKLYGIIRKVRYVNDDVFSDMIHYIYVCKFEGEPDFTNDHAIGLNWREINDAIQDENNTLSPIKGLVHILEMIRDNTLKVDTFIRDEEFYRMDKI